MFGECNTLGPFPLEIWMLVCKKLADKISQEPRLHHARQGPSSDLKALCRVSKGISPEAERALFRSYDMRRLGTYGRIGMVDDGSGFRRHLRFLRTFLDRPQLSYVKEVSLNGPFDANLPDAILSRAVETYGRLAKRLGFEPAAFPLRAFPEAIFIDTEGTGRQPVELDSMLLLVLPLFPNLKSLTITANTSSGVPHWFDTLGRMREDGAIKPFGSVVDLRLGWNGMMGCYDLFPFGPLLASTPNVQTLQLWRCHAMKPNERFIEQAGLSAFPRNIKALEMHACLFDDSTIRFLLQSCPNLERFVYHSGGCAPLLELFRFPTTIIVGYRVTARQIFEALQAVKTTLKEIDIDLTTDCVGHEQGEPLTPADFDGFPFLERVRVARVGGTGAAAGGEDGVSPILSMGDNATNLGVEACVEVWPHR
ncbi:hypothetical protein PG984_000155 [Apiospora sp. TS-2023a]